MKKKELKKVILAQDVQIKDFATALIKAKDQIRELYNMAYVGGKRTTSFKDELEFANQKIAQLEKAIYDFENELKATAEQ